jgi:hypothetical protein
MAITQPTEREPILREPEYVLPAHSHAHPVVVLREPDLDCDLATAIQRVRQDEATAKSGILIVGPETSETEAASAGAFSVTGETGPDGLRRLGSRVLALLECQERFLEELRTSLQELDASVHEESRARIKAQLRTLAEIVDWTEMVHSDLVLEGRHAKAGQAPLDLLWVVHRVAAAWAPNGPEVAIHGRTDRPCWGNEASLAELVRLAFELVALRAGEGQAIQVEIGEHGGRLGLRVFSAGGPEPIADPGLVERFRRAVERTGAAVEPDALGPGGAGLVLRLPFAEA